MSNAHAAFSGVEGYTDGSVAAIYNPGGGNGDTVISQTFNTAPGALYNVQFDYGKFGDSSQTQSLRVEVLNGATELINAGATINPTTSGNVTLSQVGGVLTIDALGTGFGQTDGVAAPTSEFSALAFTFTATGSTSSIAFGDLTGGGGPDSDGILDNVRVTALTPELSTCILASLGLIWLLVAARRKV